MRKLLLGLVGTAALVAVSGCSLNAPQVDSVRRALPFGHSAQEKLEPFAWSFSMGSTQFRVYATRVQGRRVYFQNDYGMNLVWDGDSLIIIENMPGAFGSYLSGRELTPAGEEGRWYAREGFPVIRAECSPPRLWRLSDDRFGWRQSCRSEIDGVPVSADHVVELNRDSQIRVIEAPVFPGGPRFELRKLSQ